MSERRWQANVQGWGGSRVCRGFFVTSVFYGLLGMAVLPVLAQRAREPQAVPSQDVATADAGQLVDINTASAQKLRALPGMGAAYARRVIDGRPYATKNQLVTRGILPQAAYDGIRDRIVARRPARP